MAHVYSFYKFYLFLFNMLNLSLLHSNGSLINNEMIIWNFFKILCNFLFFIFFDLFLNLPLKKDSHIKKGLKNFKISIMELGKIKKRKESKTRSSKSTKNREMEDRVGAGNSFLPFLRTDSQIADLKRSKIFAHSSSNQIKALLSDWGRKKPNHNRKFETQPLQNRRSRNTNLNFGKIRSCKSSEKQRVTEERKRRKILNMLREGKDGGQNHDFLDRSTISAQIFGENWTDNKNLIFYFST